MESPENVELIYASATSGNILPVVWANLQPQQDDHEKI